VELNGGTVDAESLLSGRRAVVEHVAEMSVALGALHFSPYSTMWSVFREFNEALVEDIVESRPPTSRIILGVRGKQILATNDATVRPSVVHLVVGTSKRPLGAFFLGDVILEWSEPLFQFLLWKLFSGHRPPGGLERSCRRLEERDALGRGEGWSSYSPFKGENLIGETSA